jgi:hypothetical protein
MRIDYRQLAHLAIIFLVMIISARHLSTLEPSKEKPRTSFWIQFIACSIGMMGGMVAMFWRAGALPRIIKQWRSGLVICGVIYGGIFTICVFEVAYQAAIKHIPRLFNKLWKR